MVEAVFLETCEAIIAGRGGKHGGTCGLGQLDGSESDTARTGLNQHRFSCCEASELKQTIVCGAEFDGDTCAMKQRDAIRQCPHGRCRNTDNFGMRAVCHGGNNWLALHKICDAISNFTNNAGALVPDDVWGRCKCTTLTMQKVSTLDRDEGDIDEHTAFTKLRFSYFFITEHFRSADMVIHSCFHEGDSSAV